MKLLLDQNLSFKICGPLSELFPGTIQVRLVGLAGASDRAIWEYVVLLDSDFAEMSALLGPPLNHLVTVRQSTNCRNREAAS